MTIHNKTALAVKGMQRSAEARKALEGLSKLNSASNTLYWERARLIYLLRKDDTYKFAYGDDGYNSWSAFCRDQKLAPSSSIQKAVNWEFFVEKHDFPLTELKQYDNHCLYYIALRKKDEPKKIVKEWVEKISSLTRQDFIQEIRGMTCLHPKTHAEKMEKIVCDVCKKQVAMIKK